MINLRDASRTNGKPSKINFRTVDKDFTVKACKTAGKGKFEANNGNLRRTHKQRKE